MVPVIGTFSVAQSADLLRAFATLLWPCAALLFIVLYRPQIAGLLQRLTRASVFGQEAEFGRALDRLSEQATQAEQDTLASPEPSAEQEQSLSEEVGQILHEAATSPKVALMALSADLERTIRQLSAATGWAKEESTARGVLRRLPGIPSSLRGAIEEFWQIRHRIVHGHVASDDEALRALDAGIAILRALDRIPTEANYVENTGVRVFADRDGTQPRADVHAVRLRTVSPRGGVSFRVFPTTRQHFEEGMRVSWEWDLDRQWGQSWSLNPETGRVEEAWTRSAEFVGRDLAEL